jgi:hypothetical protein
LIDKEGGGSLLVLPESHVLLKPLLGSANPLHMYYVTQRQVLDRAGQSRMHFFLRCLVFCGFFARSIQMYF